MNAADKKKKITVEIWGHALEIDEPTTDPKVEAVKAAMEPRVAKFKKHKATLLNALRDAYERGPKRKPFEEGRAWDDLFEFASDYIFLESGKHEDLWVSSAERRQRLQRLAKVLGKACSEIEMAMQDDIKDNLCSAWLKETTLPNAEREFEKARTGIAALKTAALRAIHEIPKTKGRPGGTGILAYGHIVILAEKYRDHTGRLPGAGDGPFAKFVSGFLTALDRRMPKTSVIDYIKETAKQEREQSVLGN
jgi:hypothetical protein